MSSASTELLELVLGEGILRATPERPILRVDGSSSRWMLDSLGFSLTPRGSRIAARALLEKLKTFEARQLATYGLTGVPLMQSVIAASGGRYRGLLVRKEVKTYGARLRIQGPVGKGPVVILDDSIASGHSIRECRRHLEDHGLEVEGAVVLVRFGFDGIACLLEEDGMRVEAVLDTDSDLLPKMEGEQPPLPNPGKWFPPLKWSGRAPERAHPATLARAAIDGWLRDGTLPKPPRALDRSYDGRGGVFVSLRRRDDVHERPARCGFWHFPEETQGPLPEELLKACALTAEHLAQTQKHPRAVLDACAIAVTFFSPLQPCTIGALDNDVYGIVVRSTVRPGVMGGALPRMPGIRDGWHQFRHAAWKNGGLYAHEPYELLRHGLTKVVEPGADWQPTGVPAKGLEVEERAGPFAPVARAWALFHLGLGPRPAPSRLSLDGLAQLYVSVYVDGAVIGCAGDLTEGRDADALFDRLAEGATRDQRFQKRRPRGPASVTVLVSLLRLDLFLGEHDASTVMTPTRFGQQALEVSSTSGEQTGILLPHVVVTHDLTVPGYAEAVAEKAGLTGQPQRWTRYHCASWLGEPRGVRRLVDGLPERSARDAKMPGLAAHWRDFLELHSTARGEAIDGYLPFGDEQRTGVAPARLAHGAWVKARVGLTREAKQDLARVPRSGDGAATAAFRALASHALGQRPDVSELRTLVGAKVATADEESQDYAPGQVLYALATAAPQALSADQAQAVLGHYRRRFRARPAWGSVAWLTMASAAWSRLLRDEALLDFAWEISEWALGHQASHGGFWNDHQPDAPGATTAVYVEGFAALVPELRRAGRARQARRLEQAVQRGFGFLARLTYLPTDAGILPNPQFAVGGVRMSLTSGEIRLDFVQHALSAALFLP